MWWLQSVLWGTACFQHLCIVLDSCWDPMGLACLWLHDPGIVQLISLFNFFWIGSRFKTFIHGPPCFCQPGKLKIQNIGHQQEDTNQHHSRQIHPHPHAALHGQWHGFTFLLNHWATPQKRNIIVYIYNKSLSIYINLYCKYIREVIVS